MMEQLLELARERKLDRVGAAYAVTAWVLVQAASIAFPAFDAPTSALRWLIVALIAGFPLTLTLTWFAQPRSAVVLKPLSGRDCLLFGLIGLVAVLLAVQFSAGVWWRGAPRESPSGIQTASSIAVLPFANLSGDPKK